MSLQGFSDYKFSSHRHHYVCLLRSSLTPLATLHNGDAPFTPFSLRQFLDYSVN